MDNKIGIVTILYNSEAVLDDFFESLSHQTLRILFFILWIIFLLIILYQEQNL